MLGSIEFTGAQPPWRPGPPAYWSCWEDKGSNDVPARSRNAGIQPNLGSKWRRALQPRRPRAGPQCSGFLKGGQERVHVHVGKFLGLRISWP